MSRLTIKYMIRNNSSINKNKNWEIGAKVNIGFMRDLEVTAVRAEKDGLPDIYTLKSYTGQQYEFIPHNGLHKI